MYGDPVPNPPVRRVCGGGGGQATCEVSVHRLSSRATGFEMEGGGGG